MPPSTRTTPTHPPFIYPRRTRLPHRYPRRPHHPRARFPSDSLWEAHGNLCLAVCPSCNQTFLPPPKSKLCTECHDPSTGARPTRRTGMLRRRVLSHYGAKVEVPAMVQEQVIQG